MNKIEKMIHDMCPNGVEYKTIGDVVNYIQPSKYLIKKAIYNDAFNTPVLTPGKTFILGYVNENFDIYEASKENPIILFDDFTCSFHWVDFKFKVKSSACKILLPFDKDKLNFRFIFYIMKTLKFEKGDHQRKWIREVSKILIPVPPLEIQNEIVKVLDKFTELTTELTTELKLRKKHYEYYRNKLLTFKESEGEVQILKISDIFDFFNGMRNVKDKWKEDGNCKFIDYLNVFNNISVDVNTTHFATVLNLNQNTLRQNDILFTSSSETPDECALSSVINQKIKEGIFMDDHLFGLRIKEEYKNIFLIDYLKFYFRSQDFRIKVKKVVKGATRFYINKTTFKNIEIPVPPLEKQQEIVEILDKLSAICDDLNDGIPKEIELRNKQYKFYRDKLLSFDQENK